TPWSDGTTHRLLSPLELIEKLAALIPPRRLNLVRYHGILAPNAHERRKTVPARRRPRSSSTLRSLDHPIFSNNIPPIPVTMNPPSTVS
ncbi:MAG: hypothetical protein HOL51_25785, partial [Gemmatimonadetes bacterium]|nr:hypothetical protein [Gemmatimonadota bacterium]MBT7585113.1 hypothetical protein [Gemmatimonadota bacterium]